MRRSVPPGPSKSEDATYFEGLPTFAAMSRTWLKLSVNQVLNSAGLLLPLMRLKYLLSVSGCQMLSG